jgi:hypothetical protein
MYREKVLRDTNASTLAQPLSQAASAQRLAAPNEARIAWLLRWPSASVAAQRPGPRRLQRPTALRWASLRLRSSDTTFMSDHENTFMM